MFRFLMGNMARRAMRGSYGTRGYGVRPHRRRSGGGLGLLIMIAGALYMGSQYYKKQNEIPFTPIHGRADSVTDGDTFVLTGQPIRLWGIDAPERGTPYAIQSTSMLQNLLRGRNIKCTATGRSHNRIVAACSVNGRDVSQVLVRLGWAKELRRISGGMYTSDEQQARAERRGIWK